MDPAQARRILRQHIDTERLLGVEAVPRSAVAPSAQTPLASPQLPDEQARLAARARPVAAPPAWSTPARPAQPPTRPAPQRMTRPTPTAAPTLAKPETLEPFTGDKHAALEAIRQRLLADEQLVQWAPPGSQPVMGEGDPNAALMFIGEGAGEQEAQQGRPFVGPAGQLLDKMIAAIGLTREAVYITNVVHFRPPENRTPTTQELLHCRRYWLDQLHIVQPRVIVALGGTAANALLENKKGITRMRGKWQHLTQVDPAVPLMPTFHPSFVLRSYTKDNRQKVWDDLRAAVHFLQTGELIDAEPDETTQP